MNVKTIQKVDRYVYLGKKTAKDDVLILEIKELYIPWKEDVALLLEVKRSIVFRWAAF